MNSVQKYLEAFEEWYAWFRVTYSYDEKRSSDLEALWNNITLMTPELHREITDACNAIVARYKASE
jgi:hypothetical protein